MWMVDLMVAAVANLMTEDYLIVAMMLLALSTTIFLMRIRTLNDAINECRFPGEGVCLLRPSSTLQHIDKYYGMFMRACDMEF